VECQRIFVADRQKAMSPTTFDNFTRDKKKHYQLICATSLVPPTSDIIATIVRTNVIYTTKLSL